MKAQLAELQQERTRLLGMIQQQRGQLAASIQPLRKPLAWADQIRTGVHWIRHHPLGTASVLALFWLRRGKGSGLLSYAWRGWKLYRQLQAVLKRKNKT